MAYMNMGESEECVLLKYYIPLRSTPFFFIFHYLFFSTPEWFDFKGLKHS